jgi:ring-1,2-phenylacetyl-CoA epoxidase subunit PaaC
MTTPMTSEFESPAAMSQVCATSLRNLLVALADTKLLLGYHYGEWTFGPPELEAAIAGCSLCQTELGHVRLLHGLLKRYYGDEPVSLIEDRPATAFANVSYLDQELEDWAGLVAANYAVDLAATRLLHALRGSAFTPLRMSLEKMLDEERYHIHHGQGWFRTLAQKGDETRQAVEASVRRALETVVEWFGPADESEDLELVQGGVKSRTNREVLQDLLDDVSQTATPLGMRIDVELPEQMPGWSPTTRRSGGAGPEEEILYHLRGSKNAVFKLRS